MSTLQSQNIPDFLAQVDRWVGFRIDQMLGQVKPLKNPINPHDGTFASSTNPATWSNLNHVIVGMDRYRYTCVGFALGDGWMGIDIDHAFTDGVLHPAAQKIVDSYDFAFTERSVSGNGIHIYFRGQKPDFIHFSKIADFDGLGADLEIYDHARFFIVTADSLRTDGVIAEDREKTEAGFNVILELVKDKVTRKRSVKQMAMKEIDESEEDEVARFSDEKVIERAALVQSGKYIRSLLVGENPLRDGDVSANDFLACVLLHRAGGAFHQIKRIIRNSKRFRDKHDSVRRPYGTWLDLTLQQAIASCDDDESEDRDDGEVAAENNTPEKNQDLPVLFGDGIDLEAFGQLQSSDLDVSLIFAKFCKDNLICTPGRGFMAWDGSRWTEGKFHGKSRAIDFVLELGEFAETLDSMENKDAVQKAILDRIKSAVRDLRSKTKIEAFASLAQAKMVVPDEKLDSHWDLLNTPDGVINLKTGCISEARPEYLITQITNTGIASTPEQMQIWTDFLYKFVDGDQEYIEFLQFFCGQFAIGKILTEQVAFAIGGGGNGKSSFFNAILKVLGGYATMLAPEALLVSKQNLDSKIMAIQGKRFALAAETEEGVRLSSSQLKKLVSTDPITARKLYENQVTFIPTHTTVLFTNHRPRVNSNDKGTWRRILLLPFTHDFRNDGSPVIPNFGDYLVENAGPSILHWVVEGAQKYWLYSQSS